MSNKEEQQPEILYVANVRLPNERAHAIQITHTCEALGKAGLQLTLVTPKCAGTRQSIFEYFKIDQSFTHKKIFTIDVVHAPGRYILRNGTFFIAITVYLLYKRILAWIHGKKIIVYVRGEVILALVPLMRFIPIFWETHQIRNYESFYAQALKRVSGIVVITERLKSSLIEKYRISEAKIVVARDAVNMDAFQTSVAPADIWNSHGISSTKKIALYAGTLSEEKGVHVLAHAAAYIPDDVQIVFLGGTDSQIENFKNLYSTSTNISIIGRVPHHMVSQYIQSAHMVVLPDLATFTFSNLYTSPMKLFEYMASGKPILASKIPSLSEVLGDETTFWFESGNETSLAEVIKEVIKSPEKASEIGARARVLASSYTWQKRAEIIKAHVMKEYTA